MVDKALGPIPSTSTHDIVGSYLVNMQKLKLNPNHVLGLVSLQTPKYTKTS